MYSKTCVKWPLLKRPKSVSKTNYCSMQVKRNAECSREHSAILSTFIRLTFVIKIFVLSILKTGFTVTVVQCENLNLDHITLESIFEWLLKTGFTVTVVQCENLNLDHITLVLRVKILSNYFQLLAVAGVKGREGSATPTLSGPGE